MEVQRHTLIEGWNVTGIQEEEGKWEVWVSHPSIMPAPFYLTTKRSWRDVCRAAVNFVESGEFLRAEDSHYRLFEISEVWTCEVFSTEDEEYQAELFFELQDALTWLVDKLTGRNQELVAA